MGPGRGAFVDHDGGAGGQRAVRDVAVAGDPAHVGGAPEHVVLAKVEHPAAGEPGVQQVARRGVLYALGLAGGAGGVEKEQRMLRVHVLRRAVGRGGIGQFMRPAVAAVMPGDVFPRVPENDHAAHRMLAVVQRLVHGGLEAHELAAAASGVGGNDDLGAGVHHPVVERAGREAAENDRVHGADARAGVHGDDGFRAHRHVDHNPVAGGHALTAQGGAQAFHRLAQFAVAQGAAVALLALVDDRRAVRGLPDPGSQAGLAGIQFAVGEPGEVRRARTVEGGGERLVPGQHLAGQFGPQAKRVAIAPQAKFVKQILLELRAVCERLVRIEPAILAQDRFDVSGRHDTDPPSGCFRRPVRSGFAGGCRAGNGPSGTPSGRPARAGPSDRCTRHR